MKNNKKGFTLIELLAVIVILAIIMVIAVPQILNVINNSRTSAWESNVKLVERAISTNATLSSSTLVSGTFKLSDVCTSAGQDITSNIKAVADISEADTVVSCKLKTSSDTTCDRGNGSTYYVTVSGKTGGQFDGQATKYLCY